MSELPTQVRRGSALAVLAGLALVVVGLVGLTWTWAAGLTSVAVLGGLLVGSGLVSVLVALAERRRSGLGTVLLTGPVSIVAGAVVLVDVDASLGVLTLVVASVLVAGGVVRLVAPAALGVRPTVWTVVAALLSIVLGAVAVLDWPVSSTWLIGALVSAHVLGDGIALAALGTVGHRAGRWLERVA
jgi:uncharacterized membrane protein HdeD (DUF308 family)